MKEREVMTIDRGVEYFVGRLFGAQASYRFSGSDIGVPQWRRLLEQVFRCLKQAISDNVVVTDRAHLNRLLEICDRATGLSGETSKDMVNSRSIRMLVELVFELLGAQPDHTAAKGGATRHSWRLDHFRSIGYTHSLAQKALLLQSTTDDRGAPTNCKEFIERFRVEHPDKYAACF